MTPDDARQLELGDRVIWAASNENLGDRRNPAALEHRRIEIMQRRWGMNQLRDIPSPWSQP